MTVICITSVAVILSNFQSILWIYRVFQKGFEVKGDIVVKHWCLYTPSWEWAVLALMYFRPKSLFNLTDSKRIRYPILFKRKNADEQNKIFLSSLRWRLLTVDISYTLLHTFFSWIMESCILYNMCGSCCMRHAAITNPNSSS